MKRASGTFVAALVLVGLAVMTAAAAPRQRQPQQPPARGGQRAALLPAGEVERLFDGYVAMQAQETLKLSDAQFPQFLMKLRVLQEARRRHLQARRQAVGELARLLRAPQFDEAAAREALRKVRDLDVRLPEEVQKAYDGIDQVLDVAQQARFRVFEEAVERKKFDLVLRARRGALEGGGPGGRRP